MLYVLGKDVNTENGTRASCLQEYHAPIRKSRTFALLFLLVCS